MLKYVNFEHIVYGGVHGVPITMSCASSPMPTLFMAAILAMYVPLWRSPGSLMKFSVTGSILTAPLQVKLWRTL